MFLSRRLRRLRGLGEDRCSTGAQCNTVLDRIPHAAAHTEDGARHPGSHAGAQGRHRQAATCEFDFEEVPRIIQAFRRMVRGLEFDVSEMAITTYICARAHGKRFTALPVFPMRAFHHGAIVYNTKAASAAPKDLEGRRVGVNRGYTVTTGVWAREHPPAPVRRGPEPHHLGPVRRRARRGIHGRRRTSCRSRTGRRWRTWSRQGRSRRPSASRSIRPM